MIDATLISVIMPAYNAEKFISESISSIIAQTYSDWELIIVDDGSTDKTKNIVLDFAEKDKRIKYYYQKNGKQGKARNKGIENSKGIIVAFLDADDLWVPEKLKEQVQVMEATNADMVFSEIKFIDENSLQTNDEFKIEMPLFKGTSGVKELLNNNCISISSVLAKKSAIVAAGLFKMSDILQFGEDFDLWLRMLLNGATFVCSQIPFVFYRKHQQQSTRLTNSRYFQIISIIKNLQDKDISAEKTGAIYLWIRRSMNAQNNLKRQNIRNIAQLIPDKIIRNICLVAAAILPNNILRKVIYKLTFLS